MFWDCSIEIYRAAKADKEADTAYARLKEAATERIADVSASQEGFRAQDKDIKHLDQKIKDIIGIDLIQNSSNSKFKID